MPTEETGCNQASPIPQELRGEIGLGVLKSRLTKQRYVELVQLGKIASEELTKHGLLRHEYCEFGNIMQRIMQLE